MAGESHRVDQHLVGFLRAVASGEQNDIAFPELFRLFKRHGSKGAVDPVGDDAVRCGADDVFKGIADKLGRVMNTVAVAIQVMIKSFVSDGVGEREIHHKNVPRDVFRLAVEARGQWDMMPVGVLRRGAAYSKGHHHMNELHIRNGGFQDAPVHFRGSHAVFGNVTVDRPKVHFGYDIVIRLPGMLRIGADHAHAVALGAQGPDQVHGGDGRAVVLLAQHVANDCNLQFYPFSFSKMADPFDGIGQGFTVISPVFSLQRPAPLWR